MKSTNTKKNRKFTKSLILSIVIILSILISGCTSQIATPKYFVGREGLTVELAKANPKSVYERENFGNNIFIKNLGSYDISEGNPAVLKINYDTYRLSNKEYTGDIVLDGIALHGKSLYFPVGEDAPLSFYFLANNLTHLRESATTEINYNLCYPYKTELTTFTCIDTNSARNDGRTAACKVTNYNGANGQGAPIVISKIEPEILLQENYVRPQFKIYIENVGDGYVTSKKNCNEVKDISEKDYSGRVRVTANLSGTILQCGADDTGTMRLIDSESYIRCFLPNDAMANGDMYKTTRGSYTSPLNIQVEYTYVITAKQELEILRNDAYEIERDDTCISMYQFLVDGVCVNKCDFCSKNPTDTRCYAELKNTTSGFKFNSGFGCSCTHTACNSSSKNGNCVEGYCTGGLYCCITQNAAKCDNAQILYNGVCIDKCEYCSTKNPTDKTVCGTTDFTGFECTSMTEEQCGNYIKNAKGCIKGYCGGVEHTNGYYCANVDKLQCKPNIEVQYGGKCITLCEYCASGLDKQIDNGIVNRPDPSICKYDNKLGVVDSNFKCLATSESDIATLRSNQYAPLSKQFCSESGQYCRDSRALCGDKPLVSGKRAFTFIDASNSTGGNRCVSDCEYCKIYGYSANNINSPILNYNCNWFTNVLTTPILTKEQLTNIYESCKLYSGQEFIPDINICLNCIGNPITCSVNKVNICTKYYIESGIFAKYDKVCDSTTVGIDKEGLGCESGIEACDVNTIHPTNVCISNAPPPYAGEQTYANICEYCSYNKVTGCGQWHVNAQGTCVKCGTYPYEILHNDVCMSKCDYCASNTDSALCKFGANNVYTVNSGFKCITISTDTKCAIVPTDVVPPSSSGLFCSANQQCCKPVYLEGT